MDDPIAMQTEFPSAMLMHPIHLSRPVDARWRRITDLAEHGGRAVDQYDDEWIRRGLRYLVRSRRIHAGDDRERVLRDFLDIDAACQLHTNPDKMKRCLVEARLLARQTVEEVAALCGLSVEAVIAYEKIFFQVLDRLEAFIFIIPEAIGIPLGNDELREEDSEKFIKLYAYQKGPMFLEIVLRYFRNGVQIPEPLDQASRAELMEAALMLKVRGLILSRVLPVAKFHRVHRLTALANELRAYADSLPERNAAPKAEVVDSQVVENAPLPAPAAGGVGNPEHVDEPALAGKAIRETIVAA